MQKKGRLSHIERATMDFESGYSSPSFVVFCISRITRQSSGIVEVARGLIVKTPTHAHSTMIVESSSFCRRKGRRSAEISHQGLVFVFRQRAHDCSLSDLFTSRTTSKAIICKLDSFIEQGQTFSHRCTVVIFREWTHMDL